MRIHTTKAPSPHLMAPALSRERPSSKKRLMRCLVKSNLKLHFHALRMIQAASFSFEVSTNSTKASREGLTIRPLDPLWRFTMDFSLGEGMWVFWFSFKGTPFISSPCCNDCTPAVERVQNSDGFVSAINGCGFLIMFKTNRKSTVERWDL